MTDGDLRRLADIVRIIEHIEAQGQIDNAVTLRVLRAERDRMLKETIK